MLLAFQDELRRYESVLILTVKLELRSIYTTKQYMHDTHEMDQSHQQFHHMQISCT